MAKIGSVSVEIKPTVSLESAVACVMMLNLFLDDNDEYRLTLKNDGDKVRWALTDKSVTHSITPESAVVIPATRDMMNHYRKLAGLEDE